MKIISRALLAASLTLCLSANAQNNPYGEVTISSPTAASLGKYGDIPVSYHTGLPQISIPIYTVKEGPLSLPISLSYHAGGLKVMEQASWVGAGWSLNAGGVITRTVQGAPDEAGTSNVSGQTHGHFSHYGYHNYLYNGTDQSGRAFSDWAPFAAGQKDGEPDLFFFNVAGYSGKFYFSDDRTPVFLPEQDIKLEYAYSGTGSISSFTLTTPDGIKYYFGKTASTTDVDPVEKTNPISEQGGLSQGNVISSWYLNKISSADDLFSINLTYVAESFAYYTLSMHPISSAPILGSPDPLINYEYRIIKNILDGVRLSQISFSNGVVNFTAGSLREDLSDNSYTTINPDYPTDEAKTLGSIEITDNSSVCKKFIFSYSYFQDNSTSLSGYLATSYGSAITTDKKRLKLNSVREQACNGSEINPAHLFEYFTEQVPRMLSFGQDHWGYANGATNSTLIPTYTINNYTQVSGANRDAAWPAMRGGALKKITYPTGGSTEFEFEPHKTWVSYITYSESSIANKTIGYDGSDPGQVTQAVNLSGGDYKLHVNSSSGGSVAGLVLRNSSNVTVASIGANPGQTVSQSVSNLPAGSYTLILTKTSLATGIGATGSLSQWVPSSTETNATVGGLRIKKITHHDAISSTNNKVINYSYEDATAKSTGILYGKPVYVQVIRNDLIKNVGYWHATNGFQPSCSANGCLTCAGTLDYYKSPSSIRPMASTQGYHIGYNEVKVSETGNGYSIYRYYGSELWQMDIADVAVRSINTVVCDADIPNYPAAPLPHDFKRGELKYEGYFDESDNILKETTYIPTYVDKAHVTPGLIITSKAITSTSTQHLGTYYELTTAKKTQTEVTAKVYTPGNPSNYLTTVTTTYHGSNYHNMPTRTVTTNSTGKTIESKTTYALDFRIISCDNTSDGLSQLSSDYASCLSTYNSTRLACGSSSTCLTSAYLYYMHCQTQARKSFVTTRRTNFTDASNTFATCKANAKANADATLKPILELQDLFINAPIEATEWKDSKLLSASFNVYNYGPTPSTMVYPDKVQSIDLAAPSATFTVVSNGSTSVSKDSRYQDESDVKFYNGNLVEVKGRDGLYTSYIWGYNNTLPIVKALNVDHATLKNAYDAVSGNLSQVRAQSSLQSALVSTYVYTPLAGMTSETDVKNLAISYEYDGLQRLKLIRDHNNNILKQFAYGYQAYAHNNAVWETTGGLRCKPCQHNASYNTDVQQQEERDVNPESSTYNTYRWTDIGTSSSCVVASWQNTATAVRCKQVNGDITGEQEQEQKDMNPCSPTYNTTRWVVVGTNTTTCPLPIYVKRTYDNYMYLGNSSYCDVILSFYQDAACTIPLSVNNFPVEIEEEVFSSYLGSTSRYYNTYYCTGTSVLVLSGVLRYYDNGLGDYETHDFYIVPNTAYQIGF